MVVQGRRPGNFGQFHFASRHFLGLQFNCQLYGDSHFIGLWLEKGRFPTLQPSSKTKFSVQK